MSRARARQPLRSRLQPEKLSTVGPSRSLDLWANTRELYFVAGADV